MCRYVTVKMIGDHAKKHRSSVIRAMKAAGVKVEKFPGCKGDRVPEREANRMLNLHWPEVGPLPK